MVINVEKNSEIWKVVINGIEWSKNQRCERGWNLSQVKQTCGEPG